jgi:hypothetical protein
MLASLFAKILIPVVILGALLYVFEAPYDNWGSFKYFSLAAALAIYLAVISRGRIRDISLIVATVLIGFAGIEAYSVVAQARPVETRAPGYSGYQPILGWGPEHPGVFRHVKLAAKTRSVIFDVNYTIDEHRNRRVISAETGPAVAFFGDSFTFGTGLQDSQTLPQIFADLYDRKLGVLNFGFPGYGPQQFLRALETDMFDSLLRRRVRLFVYETAAFHAERTSCTAGFMMRAPRYEMVDGRPTYRGACYQKWTILNQLFANTSLYHAFIEPALGGPSREDIDLYVAVLARAAELAREKYGAPTLVLYIRTSNRYLRRSGYTEQGVMQHMREAGLDVLDVTLDTAAFPGKPLTIPGDGHPSAVANAARATLIKAYIERTDPNLFAGAEK